MNGIETLELTTQQVDAIVKRVSRFLEGIEPQWEILVSGNHWEIETRAYTICTFPLIPTRDDLRRMAKEGASVAPGSLAPIWFAYLTFMAENTIPAAFLEQEIRLQRN